MDPLQAHQLFRANWGIRIRATVPQLWLALDDRDAVSGRGCSAPLELETFLPAGAIDELAMAHAQFGEEAFAAAWDAGAALASDAVIVETLAEAR
jgi:hypothetical protein